MNRTTTSLKCKKDLRISEIEKNEISLQPSEVTLHNILQFAATYRAVQVNSEKVISVIIN